MHGNRPWQVMLMIVAGVLAASALWPFEKTLLSSARASRSSKKISPLTLTGWLVPLVRRCGPSKNESAQLQFAF
jgi:hypothetical protein